MIIKSNLDHRITFIKKSSAETVNNSNVLQDDDDLQIPVLVDHTYAFIACICWTSTPAADLKYQWTEANSNGGFVTHTANAVGAFNSSYTLNGTGAETVTTYIGMVRTAVANGTLKFQWSQGTAEATNTTVNDGSWLMVIKL